MDLRKQINTAIKCLITPPTEIQSPKTELNVHLSTKIAELEELLESTDFELLKHNLKDINIEFSNEKPDVRKTFLEFCLKLLLCLKNAIETACNNFKSVSTENKSPALSPDILSVQEQNTISDCLQFVVGLGIITNLLPGVGIPMEKRTNFIDYIKNEDVQYSNVEKYYNLLCCVKALLQLIRQPSLGSVILSHHCGDILASLLQLSFIVLKSQVNEKERSQTNEEADKKLSESNLEFLQKEQQLIRVSLSAFLDRVYQPVLIRELLILQGFSQGPSRRDSNYSPPWLRKACSRLLTERLVKPHGVYSVIDAILGIGGGKNEKIHLHHKFQIIAKLISTCPKQFKSADEYFNLICPQILELLQSKNQTVEQDYLQVVCSIVMNLVVEHPDVAKKKIMFHLFQPLHDVCIIDTQGADGFPKEKSHTDTEQIVISESKLSLCIETLHKLFVIGIPPNAECLSCLTPVVGPLFHIFCFSRTSVSYLKSPLSEILTSYLCHSESEKAVSVIKSSVSLKTANSHTLSWNHHLQLQNGSNGGIEVTIKQTKFSLDEEEEMLWSDDDHENIECLMEIFRKCKKEAFVSEFFVSILQDLTEVISMNSNLQEETVIASESNVLLHSEDVLMKQLDRVHRSLLIFSILENMIGESFIQEVILRDVPLIFKFIMTLLERDINLSPIELEMEIVGTQTLTMAMTILALMITDKMTSSHKTLLKQCLPTLKILKDKHPDERIKSLAEDLVIAISTHGTVIPASRTQQSKTDISNILEDKFKCKIKTALSTDTTTSKNENLNSGTKSNSFVTGKQVKNTSNKTEKTPFQQAWYDLTDPLLPVQGHALLQLRKLLLEKDKETLDNKVKLLKVFQENLEHEDSYIYLMAAGGLSALADAFPDEIVPLLAKEFANFDIEDANHKRSPELRLKLGEALVTSTKMLGELTPKYKSCLLDAFLSGCKDSDSHVRASSLSNLGELCERLWFSLGPHVHEIFQCLSSVVKSDPSVEVRRACINVITLLLRGMGKDAFQVLDTVMLDFYKLLKTVYQQENDDVVKLHVQLALEELSIITKDFLFPQQTLQKRIQILDYN